MDDFQGSMGWTVRPEPSRDPRTARFRHGTPRSTPRMRRASCMSLTMMVTRLA